MSIMKMVFSTTTYCIITVLVLSAEMIGVSGAAIIFYIATAVHILKICKIKNPSFGGTTLESLSKALAILVILFYVIFRLLQ